MDVFDLQDVPDRDFQACSADVDAEEPGVAKMPQMIVAEGNRPEADESERPQVAAVIPPCVVVAVTQTHEDVVEESPQLDVAVVEPGLAVAGKVL